MHLNQEEGHCRGGSQLPNVRRTYVLEAKLGWRSDKTSEDLLCMAAREVLDWFDGRVPGPLSHAMYELKSDEVDQHGLQRLTTVSNLSKGYWAGRLRYADRSRGAQSAVAERTWTAEVAIRRTGDTLRVGIQMFMATRPGVDRQGNS